MKATLIDKNFEFRPDNMESCVKASIGVVCQTKEELISLLHHLQALDLTAHCAKEKIAADKTSGSQTIPVYQVHQLRPQKDADEELGKFKLENINPISDLEVD